MSPDFNADAVKQDGEFQRFVDNVSPKNAHGQQPVFFAELMLILKILWEIYSIMKNLGFFAKWWETMKVKRAMRKMTLSQQEVALLNIRNGLIVQVRG